MGPRGRKKAAGSEENKGKKIRQKGDTKGLVRPHTYVEKGDSKQRKSAAQEMEAQEGRKAKEMKSRTP